MFGGQVASFHSDVFSATPETEEQKRNLVSEIKNRAKACVSTKNYPEAIELYAKAIEVLPEDDSNEKAILYANRSMCYNSIGKFSEAESDAQTSIDSNPQYAKAFFRKTAALIGLKRFAEAKEIVQQGLQLAPSDKDLLSQQSKIDAELSITQKPKSSSSTKSSAQPIKTVATPKEAKPKDDDDDEVVEEVDEKDVVRGYKKLPDGRVTTFFNNSLDEKTKELIGDIAPKKIDLNDDAMEISNPSAVGSSWNAAGTFESRDLTTWAKNFLSSQLSDENIGGDVMPATSETSAILTIKEIKDWNGHAETIVTRGKRKHVCDFTFTLVWQLNSDNSVFDGQLLIEDLSGDGDYEPIFTVTTKNDNTTVVKTLKTELLNRVQVRIATFLQELKSKS